MMSLTFGLFTQVSGSGPLGPLVMFKYSMENQNKSLFCGASFSLCGILDVCGIDLVGYIRFEIRTYLGICNNNLTRCSSPSTHLTSESS